MIAVTYKDVNDARGYFARLKGGAEALRRMVILVGSPLRYARFVHEGTRRMRGRPFLANAVRAAEPAIRQRFASAIDKGPEAVFRAGLESGYDVQRRAQQETPVRTGSLRRSIHTVAARR